jgi:tetratricopeptide (TPR) repeat protein/transglutaminase-like putative cysteine protease
VNLLARIATAGLLAGLITSLLNPFSTAFADAQSLPPPQSPYTIEGVGRLTVRADYTATEILSMRYKILMPAAIDQLNQQRMTYIEGMETLEIVEAFTEKADGRKIRVDPSSIVTRDGNVGISGIYARDLKERVVIFRDVDVGDTLVTTVKKERLRGVFPGQFIDENTFPRSMPITSMRLVVEAPKSLDLLVKASGPGLTDQIEESGSILRHVITLTPLPAVSEEDRAVSPIDRDPIVMVSTFRSYEQLGMAYAASALPKAAVTPEIAALADEITKDIEGKKEQAAAIDAWMKRNIRYVIVRDVVDIFPSDAATVLKNKQGVCRDKAILMSALLAAKGIPSELVLINYGNAYTFPEPPTLAVMSHAILYIPELDVYADPTIMHAGFGVLAPETYDKPVVRMSTDRATVARTPPMRPEDHTYHVHTVIDVATDGRVTGRTEETGSGMFGTSLRAIKDNVQALGAETAAQRRLQSLNTPGTGRFEIDNSAKAATEPAIITGSFHLNERLSLPAAGNGFIPYGMPLMVRPGGYLLGTRLLDRKSSFQCFAGRQTEDIEATFAPGLPMPVPNASRTIDNPAFTYRSNFKVEGRTLKMHREFTSRVAGQSCPPELEAQIAADMNLVVRNMGNVFEFRGVVASSEPAKARPSIDVARAVPADQKRRIDFLYWLEPDCSSSELPVVRIIEQPKNGKLLIENGAGFTNFPQSNPRFECNKRKSDGVLVVYQPNATYIGPDWITVEVINPSGHSFKRRYVIDVKALSSADDQRACLNRNVIADTAIESCGRIISSGELNGYDLAKIYASRGDAWRMKNDYEKAIADYTEVIRLEPKDATPYNHRGALLTEKGNLDGALADLTEAIRLAPDYPDPRSNRAHLRFLKGDVDGAIADLNEAIRLNPKFVIAYNNRGNAWIAKADFDRAIADYDEAIRLNPKYVFAYNGRGNAWRDKGDLDRAIADYTEALRLEPRYANAYTNRGITYEKLGRRSEAIDDYRKAISIMPSSQQGIDGLRRLGATS